MSRLRLLRPLPLVLVLLLLLAAAPQLHASNLKPRTAPTWGFSQLWNWLTDWTRPSGFLNAFDRLGRHMDPDGGNPDPGKNIDPDGADGDLGHDMDPDG